MPSASNESRVSSLDEAPLESYRKISLRAVLALVAGILSASALIHPVLWLVPAVAVVLAVLALRAIAANPDDLSGRRLALAGLGLALLFGVYAPTRLVARQWHLYSQARGFADDWLELVRAGRQFEAHQRMVRIAERQASNTPLAPYYAPGSEPRKFLDRQFDSPPLSTLLELGDKATYEYVGGYAVTRPDTNFEEVSLRYRASFTEDGRQRELPLLVVLMREAIPETNEYHWFVSAVVEPEP